MRAYKLNFLSALHVDSRGSGEPEGIDEFIHSDTLSAAICHAWAAVNQTISQDFFNDPPFTVSSAFPYIGDIFLFPAPRWLIWNDPDPVLRKQLKSVQWISRMLFEKILSGALFEFADVQLLPRGIAISHDEFQKHPDLKCFQAWTVTERQRVSVDRLHLPKEGGLFFFALQFFAPQSGLYFMAQTRNQCDGELRSALDFLGDTGIGADRNSGLGHFKIREEVDLDLQVPDPSEGWATLSLFNPGQDDDLPELTYKTAYEIIRRAGWISNSTIGRPPLRAFTEGSYFSRKPIGRVLQMPIPVDLKGHGGMEHPVYRDFRAISLPCNEPVCLKEGY
jgi:CRISPR-associated protein Csm4